MSSSVLLFLNIGGPEMILIIFVALLLFGGEKLPEIARGLGKGIRDFKDASEGVKREITNQINSYEEKSPEPAVRIPEVAETTSELPLVAEEHPAQPEHAAGEAISEVPGVANTITYNENHNTVSEGHVSDAHHQEETAHAETNTQPVKTHE
jgi:sec-independent protein translocase protein TatA